LDYSVAVFAELARNEAHERVTLAASQLMSSLEGLPVDRPRVDLPDSSAVFALIESWGRQTLLPVTLLRLAECRWEGGDLDSALSILSELQQGHIPVEATGLSARSAFLSAELALQLANYVDALKYAGLLSRYDSEPWRSLSIAWLAFVSARNAQIEQSVSSFRLLTDLPEASSDWGQLLVTELRREIALAIAMEWLYEAEEPGALLTRLKKLPGELAVWVEALWKWVSHDAELLIDFGVGAVESFPSDESVPAYCGDVLKACPKRSGRCVPAWNACSEALRPEGPFLSKHGWDRGAEATARQVSVDALVAAMNWFDGGCCEEEEEKAKGECNNVYGDTCVVMHVCSERCSVPAVENAVGLFQRYSDSQYACDALTIASRNYWSRQSDMDNGDKFFRLLRSREECERDRREHAARSIVEIHLARWEHNHGISLEGSNRELLDRLGEPGAFRFTRAETQFIEDCRYVLGFAPDDWTWTRLLSRLHVAEGNLPEARGYLRQLRDSDSAFLMMRIAREEGIEALRRAAEEVGDWSTTEDILTALVHHAEAIVPSLSDPREAHVLAYETLLKLAEQADSAERCRTLGSAVRAGAAGILHAPSAMLWLDLARECYTGTGQLPLHSYSDWELMPVAMSAALRSGELGLAAEVLEAVLALADGRPGAEPLAMACLQMTASALRPTLPGLAEQLARIQTEETYWRYRGASEVPSLELLGLHDGDIGRLEALIQDRLPTSAYDKVVETLLLDSDGNPSISSLGGIEGPPVLLRSAARRLFLSAVEQGEKPARLARLVLDLLGLPGPAAEWERFRDNADALRIAAEALALAGSDCWLTLQDALPRIELFDLRQSDDDDRPRLSKRRRTRLARDAERIARAALLSSTATTQERSAQILVCALEEQGKKGEARKIREEYGFPESPREKKIRVSIRSGSLGVSGSGKLDAGHVVRRRYSSFRRCYEVAARKDPALLRREARLVVHLTISESGRATVVLQESNLQSPEVERCVVKKLENWRFPRPTDGIVEFTLPIIFGAGSTRIEPEYMRLPPVPETFCMMHDLPAAPAPLDAADWLFAIQCLHRQDPALYGLAERMSALPEQAVELFREFEED